ncbi:MAG: response regulator, partial [Planctomycetaceae bacterium]
MIEKPMRILLIEDDPVDQQLINRSLSQLRLSIDLVCEFSLNDGLSQLAKGKFDIVLTDLSLPDSFGLESVQRIRERDEIIPIIVLTTLDDKEVEFTSLSVGAQDYLLKDHATPHNLERAIYHAIQRQQYVVENQRLLAEVEFSRELLLDQKELLKRKNQRLRRLYKTAHRFVDNVSHEFRTPLTVIKDYVSLVREGMVGEVNAEQCRMLDIAGVRADDLNNMVDDMLDVSKLESGLLGAWRRPCRLADIVESLCPPLAKKAEVKGIAFEVAIDRSLPAVNCDAEKDGRVIIKLVTNAMKICGEPGC